MIVLGDGVDIGVAIKERQELVPRALLRCIQQPQVEVILIQ